MLQYHLRCPAEKKASILLMLFLFYLNCGSVVISFEPFGYQASEQRKYRKHPTEEMQVISILQIDEIK
jgi:hypothetical protein